MSGHPRPAIPRPPAQRRSRPRHHQQPLLPGHAGLPAAGAWPVMAGVPGGPVQAPPPGFIPPPEQAQILADVLAGIELGAWDRQIVQWLAGLDACTVLTVASLIARARAAGAAGSRR